MLLVSLLPATERARAQAPERSIAEALTVSSGDACLLTEPLSEHIATWLHSTAIDARLAITVLPDAAPRRGASVAVRRDAAVIGVRRFDRLPADCSDRRAAIGLAIALAIDATALDTLSADRASPTTATDSETTRAGPAPAPAAPAPATTRRPTTEGAHDRALFHLAAGADAMLVIGLAIDPAAGGAFAFEGALANGALRLSAFATVPVEAPIGNGAATISIAGASLVACARGELPFGDPFGCLGASAGVLSAEGLDFPQPLATELPWLALDASIGLRVHLVGALAIRVAVGGTLRLTSLRLDVLGSDGAPIDSRTLPRAGLTATVGPELILW